MPNKIELATVKGYAEAMRMPCGCDHGRFISDDGKASFPCDHCDGSGFGTAEIAAKLNELFNLNSGDTIVVQTPTLYWFGTFVGEKNVGGNTFLALADAGQIDRITSYEEQMANPQPASVFTSAQPGTPAATMLLNAAAIFAIFKVGGVSV